MPGDLEEMKNGIEGKISSIMETIWDWIWEIDAQGVYTYASPRVKDLLGYDPSEVVGKTPFHFMPSWEVERVKKLYNSYTTRCQPFSMIENVNLHRDGHEVILETSGVPIFHANGELIGYRGVDRDITARKKADSVQKRLLDILKNTPDFVSFADIHGRVLYYNDAAYQMLEIGEEEMEHIRISDTHPSWVGQLIMEEALPTAARKGVWRGETVMLSRSGREIPVSQIILAHSNDRGEVEYYSTITRDMTREKQLIGEIQHMAYTDPLTGLPNRSFLYDHATKQLEEAKREQGRLAVLFLDMDGFKQVNDTIGHNAGDELLKWTAQCLKQRIGEQGVLARIGGDEFIVLLSQISDAKQVESVAEQLLQALSQPMTYKTRELSVTISVGISCFPQDGEDIETLIKHADEALYKVKENGKNGYQFFSSLKDVSLLINEIHQGLLQEQFQVFYQPQMDIATGNITGLEALIRWQHPGKGLVSAAEFVSQAEQIGLINQMDGWVLTTVCKQIQKWQQRGYPTLRVAVNLSMRTFKKNTIVETITRILAETELEANLLEIEVTESWMMQHPSETIQALTQLRELGITIALDDFGTGYSSLNYLKHFPLDVLKIDKSFIQNIPTDNRDQKIVQTIIELAHHLHLKVVAEGVETEEQLRLLSQTGCDYSQGYLFSRPLPAADVEKYFLCSGNL